MGFLVPAFLAGFVAVVVPIVLHLRHRDKDTPHRFPSLMFVERLPIRTAQRRRITDWPLLLLRALAIILLVVAFARPLWWKPGLVNGSVPPRTMVLVLDKSASMSHRAVWSAAQDSVRRIVQSLGAEDRAALVLFDDQAEVAQPLTTDKALLLAAVAKAAPGAAGTRYASGLRAARQIAVDANT
ncbi:MAG: BatA domain-containing protein, partial [Gemmatimonadetes bacterium]|nr:BatA domain-containing protein [Gemmatimonadota bacterium]